MAVEITSGQEPPCHYDVFLSCAGEETDKAFADHLHEALLRHRITTFRRRPNSSSQHAIQRSRISLLVFSDDYPFSARCLRELLAALRLGGRRLLPLYYNVHPSRLLALCSSRHRRDAEKAGDAAAEEWKQVLRQLADANVGTHSMVFQSQDRYYESQFVEEVVDYITNKLNRATLYVDPYLVGIDSRTSAVTSWIQDGSDDVGIATISGLGGIGKSTIAMTAFNHSHRKFQASSFLSNIRQTSEQKQPKDGLLTLQRQLVSDLLLLQQQSKLPKIYNLDHGLVLIRDALRSKRVLVVLDDVDEPEHFDLMIGMKEWLHSGSKVLITTRRDEAALLFDAVDVRFGVDQLNFKESMQLFSWHAFGQDNPESSHGSFARYCETAVELCSGLPLALRVLGSSLAGRDGDVWESALQRLKAVPNCEVQEVLEVSFDCLEDEHDKNLFLHISCFFTGMDLDYVVAILDGCKFYSAVGIRKLASRCLLSVGFRDNKLAMHQLLRGMGREIVRRESPDDPGKRSRVWCDKDSFHVLREDKGTEAIKGLSLDMNLVKGVVPERQSRSFFSWKWADSGGSSKAGLKTNAMGRMKKLQLLKLDSIELWGDYREFPKSLVWLFWRGFPLSSIPNNIHLERVVALDLRRSNLVQVWKSTRFLSELKILNLSHSHDLITTPKFTGLPSLQILKLKDCINLVRVDESIGKVSKLYSLNLKDCKNLKKLPRSIGSLESLITLIVSGCSKLNHLPLEIKKLSSLAVLHADATAINQLSPSISFNILPWSLTNLSLSDCGLMTSTTIPSNIDYLPCMEYLDLSGNPIEILPEPIGELGLLQYLILDRCGKLKSLPELPSSLKDLRANKCDSLHSITNLPNLLSRLYVELYDCDKLSEVGGLFKLEPVSTTADHRLLLLNSFGVFDLESLVGVEVEMGNVLTSSERKGPVELLRECGISSMFIPGNEVPGGYWLSAEEEHDGDGESSSAGARKKKKKVTNFHIPKWDWRTCGVNVCVLYTCDDVEVGEQHYIRMRNKSNGVKWTYSPTFYGIPGVGEDMLWLSNWELEDGWVRSGDDLEVSVTMSPGFVVKSLGIQIKVDEKRRVGDGDGEQGMNLVRYEVRKSDYFLCNHEFHIHQDIAKSGWAGVYDYLFQG